MNRLSDRSFLSAALLVFILLTPQILMSVKTQNSLRYAAKNVTTSPAASCAAVRRASTPKTTSTASVRVTAQVRGQCCISDPLASCLPVESDLQQLFQESWDFPVKEKHYSLQLWGPTFILKPHPHTQCIKGPLCNSVFKLINHQMLFHFSRNNLPWLWLYQQDCVVCTLATHRFGYLHSFSFPCVRITVKWWNHTSGILRMMKTQMQIFD